MIWQPPNITDACTPSTANGACTSGYVLLSLLVQLFGGSADERKQQQCNKDAESKEKDGRRYDFIVVGAGAAGCVVANRLSENPKCNVLLLEAGPEQPDITLVPGLSNVIRGSSIDWQFSTEPNGKSCLARPEGKCSWPLGKMMGGSSSFNGLVYVRGNRVDYDEWARLGNKGWSYKDVLPFFKKSERNVNIKYLDSKYHGTKGEQYVSWYPYIDEPSIMLTEAQHQAGLPINDYNGYSQIGAMQAQTISFEGERVSTNNAFIQPIRYKRPNLHIETNSEAIKILIDKFNKAYGINYLKDGKQYTAYATKEVIISAGVINSPKLLMLSGIGPKDHLERMKIPVVKDLAVGENLHDHVTFNGLIFALSNETATTVTQDEMLCAIQDYAKMKVKRGPLSGNGPVNSIAFLESDADLIAPDIQVQIRQIVNWREYVQDPILADKLAIFPTPFYDSIMPRITNLMVKSRGAVLLNETNPYGPPLIFPNYFGDESDFESLLEGVRFVLSLEDTEAFQSLGAYFIREELPHCKDYKWGTDEYFICLAKAYTSSTYHPAGTCKMGPKCDKKAVLDNELRVYGVRRLRVIDSSMMPFVIRGNTNAPSIMIGERGVDFVKKYWRKRTKYDC